MFALVLACLSSVPVTGIRSSISETRGGRDEASSQATAAGGAQGPRLFSATFNYGNILQARPEDADELLKAVVAGHEDSDVVILGFQEFADICKDTRKISRHIAQTKLWVPDSTRQLKELTASIAAIGKPTPAANAAFSELRQTFSKRYSEVGKHISQMDRHFGGSNASFLDHVQQTSPFTRTVQVGNQVADATNVSAIVEAYHEGLAVADEVRFAEVRGSASSLYNLVMDLPKSEDLQTHLEELHGWRRTGDAHFASWEAEFPNLRFNQEGVDKVRLFKNSMALAENALYLLDNRVETMGKRGEEENVPKDELVFLTAKFLPDHKIVTVTGGEQYMCCCRQDDEGTAVTCEVVSVNEAKARPLRRGCLGLKGKGYHSWVTIRKLPEFIGLAHAGECVVPRSKLRSELHEQMLVAGPAFTIRGAGDERINGDYEMTGWYRSLPQFTKRGNPKAVLQWSQSRNSWRLFFDTTYFGYKRGMLYEAGAESLGSRRGRGGMPPAHGWRTVDGKEPPPRLVFTSDVTRDASPMRVSPMRVSTIGSDALPKLQVRRPEAPRQATLAGTLEAISRMPKEVETETAKEEAALMARLRKTLASLSEDLSALRQDLTDMDEARAKVAVASSSMVKQAMSTMSRQVTSLKDQNSARLERLIRPYTLELTTDFIEVPAFDQTFNSGTKCKLVNHHDTALHVFANPWSPWEVVFPDRSQEDHFNINNNGDHLSLQCGKAVNVMRFKMRHKSEGRELSICAMNTHMSYKYETSSRMEAISEAMASVDRLGCDATVFVGDFNSRLHCAPEPKGLLARYRGDYCRHTPLDDACHRPAVLEKRPSLIFPTGWLAEDMKRRAVPTGQHRAPSEWRLLWRDQVVPSDSVLQQHSLPLASCQALCDVTTSCKSIEHCMGLDPSEPKCVLKASELVGSELPTPGAEGCQTYQRVTPFMKVKEAYCKEGRCSLSQAMEVRFADELMQLLLRPNVSCYEGKAKDGGHELKVLGDNPVLAFGFREAAEPDFAFTYKVCSEKDIEELPSRAWQMCLEGDSACLCQPLRKGLHAQNHNLAWTDRVIIREGGDAVTLKTAEYSRRMPSTPTGSDHLPVVAIIDVVLGRSPAGG